MGKTEPLLNITSDSVRCSSSAFVVPRSREVVAIDADRWPSSRQGPQGESEEVAEGAGEQKLEEGRSHDSSGDVSIFGEPSSPEQGEKQIPDLNAAPQQKQRRRRKHRPKVIVEGERKRPGNEQAATTSTPKSSGTAEKRKHVRRRPTCDADNPRVKRKYVRKNELFDPCRNPLLELERLGSLKDLNTWKNRPQKRRQAQNLPRQGATMLQQHNESAPHIDAIWKYLVSVDEIAEKLKDLDINGETGIQCQQCSALGHILSNEKYPIVECGRN